VIEEHPAKSDFSKSRYYHNIVAFFMIKEMNPASSFLSLLLTHFITKRHHGGRRKKMCCFDVESKRGGESDVLEVG